MTNAELIARLTAKHGAPRPFRGGSLYWPGVAYYEVAALSDKAWLLDFGTHTRGMTATDAWAALEARP